ncbi:aminotransferase class III-fold pyridoxal phosphate-dependent enzyme [Verminephrobacter eiseniae]|uniref:diaminobutyrate--2-oxoglutarate transaminase family protein n=1 Tax=Verminephrobacter eiseniae TaxID=364317 RepID=UPI0022384669|nr:diaminobutyrate--2-oxoglutarate transaminase family protein [Verminephrobacter eiseniae]MCW5263384.1 aminotransferase class III-fold pyridoxal phosphate-dependent enzyme [Verminephrobacter eiseniae]
MVELETHRLHWSERESNARTYARGIDRVISKGNLARVYDSNGREYVDCLACAGALPLGHNHPLIQQRVVDFLNSGQLQQALDIATPAKLAFIEQLYRVLPPAFAKHAKIQFCGPSGSDGIEASLKLFKTATGRRSVLVFQGAYHGMTMGSLGMMGNLEPKQAVSGYPAEIQFLPFPYGYRSPFGTNVAETERLSLVYLENLLSDPESGVTKPAMLLVEPIQGEGGCIPVSVEWLIGLRDITARYDVPLVMDEVQTGFGRSGDMFAHEWAGIVPDAIVMSKAIGGGYPLAVMAYHEKYDKWNPGAHAGTFRGNQIALISGAATLEYLQRPGVLEMVRVVGLHLQQRLQTLQDRFSCIGEVRGRGLMLGVELIDPNSEPDALGRPQANGTLAKALKRACLEYGLIIESGGRHGAVMRFLPPLIITANDVDIIIQKFEAALESLWSTSVPNLVAFDHCLPGRSV